jgi:hypothetical protein
MNKTAEAARLRKAAEARLKAVLMNSPASVAKADADLRRTLHELQVHQIELEMQNHELIEARTEREAALARYTELYDFAPIGYLTLYADGLIKEVNLTGASLLGVARRNLYQKRFDSFVVQAERPHWAHFLPACKRTMGRRMSSWSCTGAMARYFSPRWSVSGIKSALAVRRCVPMNPVWR